MRKLAWTAPTLIATLSVLGCGDDVPIGHGAQNTTGSGGASGGNAGAGGSAAAGSGATGSGASGGSAGAGGSGATGGSAGAGGSGATPGGGGTASGGGASGAGGSGGSVSCPVAAPTQLTALASGWPLPRGVAIDADNVYFVNWNNGNGKQPSVVKVAKAGGGETVLGNATLYPAQKSAFAGPETLMLVADTLYFRAASGSEVWKMPKTGGAPSALYSAGTDPIVLNTPPTAPAYSMGVDAQAVYFSRTFWTSIGSKYTSGIYRVPLTGGAPSLIAEDQNDVNQGVGHAGSVLVDGSKVIWGWWHEAAPGSDGKLRSSGVDGSAQSTLVQTGQVQGIALDQTHAYYAQGPFLMRVAKTGGAPEAVGQLPGTSPIGYGIALDANYVYLGYKDLGALPGQCGGVARLPKTGGAATVLATGERPAHLAVDATHLYYSDLEAGTVMKLALP